MRGSETRTLACVSAAAMLADAAWIAGPTDDGPEPRHDVAVGVSENTTTTSASDEARAARPDPTFGVEER